MVYGQKPQSIKYFTIMYHKHMSSHVGKDVVLYQSTDVKLLKSLLTMARSIVIEYLLWQSLNVIGRIT